jgi:hypothetical protein
LREANGWHANEEKRGGTVTLMHGTPKEATGTYVAYSFTSGEASFVLVTLLDAKGGQSFDSSALKHEASLPKAYGTIRLTEKQE